MRGGINQSQISEELRTRVRTDLIAAGIFPKNKQLPDSVLLGYLTLESAAKKFPDYAAYIDEHQSTGEITYIEAVMAANRRDNFAQITNRIRGHISSYISVKGDPEEVAYLEPVAQAASIDALSVGFADLEMAQRFFETHMAAIQTDEFISVADAVAQISVPAFIARKAYDADSPLVRGMIYSQLGTSEITEGNYIKALQKNSRTQMELSLFYEMFFDWLFPGEGIGQLVEPGVKVDENAEINKRIEVTKLLHFPVMPFFSPFSVDAQRESLRQQAESGIIRVILPNQLPDDLR